jgi:hypothetical protein
MNRLGISFVFAVMMAALPLSISTGHGALSLVSALRPSRHGFVHPG